MFHNRTILHVLAATGALLIASAACTTETGGDGGGGTNASSGQGATGATNNTGGDGGTASAGGFGGAPSVGGAGPSDCQGVCPECAAAWIAACEMCPADSDCDTPGEDCASAAKMEQQVGCTPCAQGLAQEAACDMN
ncbi:MAG TPA: hypothetical protein ENK57_17550 [Polyangiaceae bacterium]|nr:hypothetical protein [Polyangiaceae bacterium]